jgi:hypothetical protein
MIGKWWTIWRNMQLNTGYRIQDTGYRMREGAGYRMQDTGCRMQEG